MKNKIDFSKLLQFFREKPPALPGDSIFNDKFCEILVAASSAEEASIWQLDSKNQLHPVNGTNFTFEEVRDVILNEGEGIGGAVVISRRTMVVSHALSDPRHDPQMDERIDFRTHSMISAPILFGDKLYGVVNILNHESGKAFPLEWEEKLSIAGILYAAALAAAGRLTLYDEPRIKDERKNTQFPIDKTVVVGASWAIQELLQLCVKAGRSDVPVLIRGETGTGKELAAERIHQASKRSGEFITINSAGLPETLLESELFGHVKGAFTGASKDKKGHFELADEGTLFLDEIGDMSLACQAKILRALQEKKISPVGSEKNITCDVRIIAATNRDLRKMMEEGSFRDDLFYRVCAIEVLMPPLRERPDDIPLLVNYFLKRAGAEGKKQNPAYQLPKISAEALEMLTRFGLEGFQRRCQN